MSLLNHDSPKPTAAEIYLNLLACNPGGTMSYAKSLSLPLVVLALLATSSIAQTDKLPDITNTRVHSPTVASSGQPSKGQFEDISRSGVEVVINLAPKYLPDSIRNERKLVRSEGMEYFFIPVDWDRPSQNDVDKFLTAMDKVRGKRVLGSVDIHATAMYRLTP
jgi:protein tyrosine phosphatase (PTP) superfamily phosphohydrolase (DUF442 family)